MVTLASLEKAVGGLSTPSKMPGYAYGLPAKRCLVGSQLRKLQGSVCSKCYALKGMYVFPCVVNAQARRLRIVLRDINAWKENMIALLDKKLSNKSMLHRVFRWHDSGDIQSPEHFAAIVEIAERLPAIRFWLPTRERAMVQAYPGRLPRNLVVRVSAAMIGQPADPPAGFLASTVAAGRGFPCGAWTRGGKCGDCRACWDPGVRSIDYKKH